MVQITRQPKPETPEEQVRQVRTFRTSALCGTVLDSGKCPGALEHDGYSVPLMTPLGPDTEGRKLHRHACSACGRPAWLSAVYPRIQYTAIPETES